jgi:hypothetical protein
MKESTVPDTSSVVGGRLRSGDNDRVRYNTNAAVVKEEVDVVLIVSVASSSTATFTFDTVFGCTSSVLITASAFVVVLVVDGVVVVVSTEEVDKLIIPYKIANRLAACRIAANATMKRGDVETNKSE